MSVNRLIGGYLNALKFACKGGEYRRCKWKPSEFLTRLFEKRLRVLYKRAEISPKEMALGAVHFVFAYPGMFFGLAMVVVLGQSAPAIDKLPQVVQEAYYAANVVGIVWFVVWCVMKVLQNSINFTSASGIVGLAVSVIERLALLSVGLLVIRMFGPVLAAMLTWVKNNPDTVLSTIAGISVVRVMFALASSHSVVTARGHEAGDGVFVAIAPRQRTTKDIHRTAVHEAGHLILFADLPELPADLTVTVLTEINGHDEYRGYVKHSFETWPEVRIESFLRWSMLTCLAGVEAEFISFGERTEGAQGDNRLWLNHAMVYLTAGFGEVFYADPVGDAQMAHNRAVLNDLKTAHVAELSWRLTINKTVLNDLAAVIADKKTLGRDEIASHLARVELNS